MYATVNYFYDNAETRFYHAVGIYCGYYRCLRHDKERVMSLKDHCRNILLKPIC